MKTKLLLMLLFVFAITAGLNAQDQEQTATPKVEIHLDDTTYWWSIATVVTISHDDPNAEIYFRYCSKSYDSWKIAIILVRGFLFMRLRDMYWKLMPSVRGKLPVK